MNYRPLLVAGTLLISLFIGCSKQPAHNAWTSSDSIIIEPGVSVGPVHSGMTMKQMVAKLGEPDQKRDGIFIYEKLGFVVQPDKGDIVHMVFCSGPGVVFSNYYTKPFTGHTKEGVGIGASRAEVVQAYGNPTSTKSYGSKSQGETIIYDSLGVIFSLRDDKVCAIIVSFKS